MRSLFCVSLFLAVALPSSAQTYQMLLDGEDTAYSVKSGWFLDKTGSYLGNYRFSAPGPGTGAAQCVWTIDAIPPGTYDVEFYVDNGDYAQTAQYIVESDNLVTTVTRSQNFAGAGWKSLGSFAFNGAGRITQTDYWTGAGSKVIADAIRITLQGPPAVPTVNVVPPEVTIVVDDLGSYNPTSQSDYTYQLFQGAPQFCYAIIPFWPYATAVLQNARTRGIETILHQPLQYIGQPDFNAGDPTRLYINMTDAQILTCLRNNLQSVSPYVEGVNNHQGSRFSQFPHGLNVALGELKAQNIYWLDSRTISDSYSYDLAKQQGILAAERDLFVDGSTVQNTKDLILSVATRAKYAPNCNYVMICHQRAATVPGLLDVIDEVEALGVSFTPLKKNLHYIVESDFQPPGASFTRSGNWTSTSTDMISHECYDGDSWKLAGAAAGTARFTPNLPRSGNYRVFVGYNSSVSNLKTARVTVKSLDGTSTRSLDQSVEPNRWHYIGQYPFGTGTGGYVELDNAQSVPTLEVLKADCVKFSYAGELPTAASNWHWFH